MVPRLLGALYAVICIDLPPVIFSLGWFYYSFQAIELQCTGFSRREVYFSSRPGPRPDSARAISLLNKPHTTGHSFLVRAGSW